MAKKSKHKTETGKETKNLRPKRPRFRPFVWLRRWVLRLALGAVVLVLGLVVLFAFVNPPTTPYMIAESRRLGGVDHSWVSIEEVSPRMVRAVVAAEDANFCNHWGFDMVAIRAAIAAGGKRGGSTISQQVVKNVYLWQGRSWVRKVLEAVMTPMVEAVWTKRRILEVYLNVAEFDEGVFGVEAAARHYFGVGPEALTPTQAARLAAVLPNPKKRSASKPSRNLRKRSRAILSGADTILADGRSACFEG
ncbi:MAG: monofunctional biosynthetic peptidoglycan transglycosylase [Rhodobacterales bacterium]|nr:MAG: monofunctional biosynthetic peptidoglycan transglycosylase [Rhodobacterales bacterium]